MTKSIILALLEELNLASDNYTTACIEAASTNGSVKNVDERAKVLASLRAAMVNAVLLLELN